MVACLIIATIQEYFKLVLSGQISHLARSELFIGQPFYLAMEHAVLAFTLYVLASAMFALTLYVTSQTSR